MQVTEQRFANLIGGYGFETYEQGAFDMFKDSFGRLVHDAVGGGQAQAGGRVSMPGDYFGLTEPGTSSSAGTNADMAHVTDSFVRPALPATFEVSVQKGGSSEDWFDMFLKDIKQGGGVAGLRMKKEHKVAAKKYIADMISKMFKEVRKVAKKTKHLNLTQLKRALKKI